MLYCMGLEKCGIMYHLSVINCICCNNYAYRLQKNFANVERRFDFKKGRKKRGGGRKKLHRPTLKNVYTYLQIQLFPLHSTKPIAILILLPKMCTFFTTY